MHYYRVQPLLSFVLGCAWIAHTCHAWAASSLLAPRTPKQPITLRQRGTTSTRLYLGNNNLPSRIDQNDDPLSITLALGDVSRRTFLSHTLAVTNMATSTATGIALADNDETTTSSLTEDKPTADSADQTPAVATPLPSPASSSTSSSAPPPPSDPASPSSEGDIKSEEKELVAELKVDQKDQSRAEKETDELIAQLEKQEASSATSSTSTVTTTPTSSTTATSASPTTPDTATVAAQQEQEKKTQQLIEKLEKDEEKVEAETLQLIDKVEKLEAQAEKLQVNVLPEPTAKTTAESAAASAQETKEFIAALKERSVENQDLIEMLKQKSKNYVNEKTGKYNAMSKETFLQRKEEYMKRENAAGQLMQRFGEEISAERDILMQPDGFLDKLGKRAQKEFLADKQAVEEFLEKEDVPDLLEKLRARAKATDEFSALYNSFLNRLQSGLGGDSQ